MNKTSSFTIEKDLFAAATALLPGERGALSPLGEFGGEPLSRKAIQGLKKTGLITSSGSIEADFQSAMLDLLNPIQVFSIDLMNRDREDNFAVYLKNLKSNPLGLQTSGNRLDVQTSNFFETIGKMMDGYFPIGQTDVSGKTLTIPVKHAWTLAAMLDLQRQNSQTAKSAKGFSRKQIAASLANFNESPAWLWLSTLSILSEAEPNNGVDIEGSLSWLLERNFLIKKGSGYLPAGETDEIGRLIRQPLAVLNILSAQKASAIHIDYQKLACFGADNAFCGLAYRVGEENAHLIQRPLADLFNSIKLCVENAVPLFTALDIEPREILSIPCPACGQLQNPASKFCKDCGEALSAGEDLDSITESTAATGTAGTLRDRLSQKTQDYLAREAAENVPSKKKPRWWLIPLIILGVIVLGCLIASLFVPITIRF
jgi:hypothetical protein